MNRRFRLRVEGGIYELASSFAGLVLYVDGVQNTPSDGWSEALLREAEQTVRALPYKPEHHPHMLAWADVYRAFGARPKRYRNGCLALARRAPAPRVNALVDAYNAIAMKHMVPIGGEDWERLASDLVRTRARGDEPFIGAEADGAPELAQPGEPVWMDAAGVTTRRFNWRQARRTRITLETRAAYFVFDAVAPFSIIEVRSAATDLLERIKDRWPAVRAELAPL